LGLKKIIVLEDSTKVINLREHIVWEINLLAKLFVLYFSRKPRRLGRGCRHSKIEVKYLTIILRKVADDSGRIAVESEGTPGEVSRSPALKGGTGHADIEPDGTVVPCVFLPLPIGNVRNRSFKKIWENNKIFNILRDSDSWEGAVSVISVFVYHFVLFSALRAIM